MHYSVTDIDAASDNDVSRT